MSRPQPPIFNFPKLPDLTAMYPGLAAIAQRAKALESALFSALAPLRETFRVIGEQNAVLNVMESTGWLPHSSTPYEQINAQLPREEMDRILEKHYLDNWAEAEKVFISNLNSYSVDDETKETVTEGLRAHSLGLFRVAPRLLFPEIERVARTKLHGGEYTTITSQKTLQEAAGELGLNEFSTPGMYGLALYRKLISHLYAKTDTEERRTAALADPVPNRHATLHGIVNYSTAKSSVNMLIMCDFILGAITAIELNSTEQAESNDGT